MLLFHCDRWQMADVPDHGLDWTLESDQQTEVAKIAMYLANRGFVRGALDALMYCSRWVIKSPLLVEEILDCFLENGAVLNDLDFSLELKPLIVSLLAKKSILHLEGMSPMAILHTQTHGHGYMCPVRKARNATTIMLLQGKICGTVDQKVVNEIHTILRRNLTNLPDKFLPLEKLYEMTGKAPSLKQLARRQIWRRLANSGNISRESIQRLEVEFGLPRELMEYVQADDPGLEIDAIMKKEW